MSDRDRDMREAIQRRATQRREWSEKTIGVRITQETAERSIRDNLVKQEKKQGRELDG